VTAWLPSLKGGRDLRNLIGTDSLFLVSVFLRIFQKFAIFEDKQKQSKANEMGFFLLVGAFHFRIYKESPGPTSTSINVNVAT
jgi:hypothetical protein